MSYAGNTRVARPSLVREYFKTEPRRLAIFGLALVGVVIVVTIPYVALVGFDTWANNMTEASHMIWASYTPAATNLPTPVPPTPPPATGAREDTVELTPLVPLASGGRSYVCTQCGSTALPNWDAAGTPHCPSCQGLMTLAPKSTPARGGIGNAAGIRPPGATPVR